MDGSSSLAAGRSVRYDPCMRLALKLHPDSRCRALTGLEVEMERPRFGELILRYCLSGKLSDLRLPPKTASARGDELWQHTCFEAFVRAAGSAGYYELNFAPSTEWAAYLFNGYREGMRVATDITDPRIGLQSGSEHLELEASVKLELSSFPAGAAWQLGLSAVIEEASGRKSYWALAHPPGKADFHHPDCFVCELSAA